MTLIIKMKIFNKLFKKNKDVLVQTKQQVSSQETIEPQSDTIFKNKHNKVCKYCRNSITPTEGYTKQGGYFWHRKCWINAKRSISKMNGL